MSKGKTRKITKNKYSQLLVDTKTFAKAALMISQQVPPKSQPSVAGIFYLSYKTVSHFCIGMALELRLKSFLYLKGIQYPEKHNLVQLYDLLPDDIAKELERIFKTTMKNNGIVLEALTRSDAKPQPTKEPFKIDDFRDFCCVCDQQFKLSLKRYSWEEISQGKYEFYLKDIVPLHNFLGESETLQTEIAKEKGLYD